MTKTLLVATMCIFVLASVDLYAQEKAQEDNANAKAADVKNANAEIFGIDAPYVDVYRKNHPQGRATKLFNVEMKSIDGRSYLVGNSSAENSSTTYMYLFSDVQLMTFPNADYANPNDASKSRKPLEELSLKNQVLRLKWDLYAIRTKKDSLRQVISSKKAEVSRLEKRIKRSNDQELCSMLDEEKDAIAEELELFDKTFLEMESKIAKQHLSYVKKRRDAVVNGVYDHSLEQSQSRRNLGAGGRR